MASTLEDLNRRTATLERARGKPPRRCAGWSPSSAASRLSKTEHTLRLERLETRLEKVEARLNSVEAKVDALPRAIAEMIAASEQRLMTAIASR